MRYELTDNEWAAIRPMLPNKPVACQGSTAGVSSMASSGCCDLVHHGATFPMTLVRIPLATIALFAGEELASGIASWRHWPPPMMLRCR